MLDARHEPKDFAQELRVAVLGFQKSRISCPVIFRMISKEPTKNTKFLVTIYAVDMPIRGERMAMGIVIDSTLLPSADYGLSSHWIHFVISC